MRRLFVTCLVLGLALPAAAQTPATATSKLGWDQIAPTLATANGYQYALYVDAGARTVLTGTLCTGTVSPFVCTGALPPMTPATHTLELTTADIVSIPGTTIESVKSSPFAIRLVVAPAAGTGLRIVPGS